MCVFIQYKPCSWPIRIKKSHFTPFSISHLISDRTCVRRVSKETWLPIHHVALISYHAPLLHRSILFLFKCQGFFVLKSLPVHQHLLPHPFIRFRALAHFLGLVSSRPESVHLHWAMVSYCPICGKPVYFGESGCFLSVSLTSCFLGGKNQFFYSSLIRLGEGRGGESLFVCRVIISALLIF